MAPILPLDWNVPAMLYDEEAAAAADARAMGRMRPKHENALECALVLLAWALIIALSPLLLVLIAWDGLGITVTRPYPPAAPRPA